MYFSIFLKMKEEMKYIINLIGDEFDLRNRSAQVRELLSNNSLFVGHL